MPNSELAEVAQAQHVGEVERVGAVPLELVPVGRLLQGLRSRCPRSPQKIMMNTLASVLLLGCTRQGLWPL